MKITRQCNDGFTLIEVIVSIAILSVVSVIALQLFMTAQRVNTRSRLSDMATIVSTNSIEMIRLMDTTDSLEHDLNYLPTETGYESSRFIDQYVSTNDYIEGSDHIKFTVTLTEDKTLIGLYDLHSVVIDLNEDRTLADTTTKHYFKGEVSNIE